LPNLKHLSDITLSDNKIGDVGAFALSKMISSIDQLEGIYLSNNQITNTGAMELVRAAAPMQNLKYLFFTGNNIAPATKTKIRAISSRASSVIQV
jgi:Ran GTPase-activating protein (RanGAP) involved in mRNA processing and transport